MTADSRNGATPGPWEWRNRNTQLIAPETAPLGIKTGELLIEVTVGPSQANAHLIAAAPELEAELEYIVSYFEGGIMPLDLRDWKERAIAALRKARP